MRRAARAAWAGMLAAALALGAAQPQVASGRLGSLLADPGGAGFARAIEPRGFEFPPDHGPHPEFRHEWWYFTGHLEAAGGERFGFELTFFRFALAPFGDAFASARAEGGTARSAWRTQQLYAAHFAVADLGRKEFRYAERFVRGALGLAGAQSAPLRVWLEDWSLEEAADSAWRLHAGSPEYVLDLELRALLAPVLNGDRGLSRKSAATGAASYYYSIPRLAAHGTLERARAASGHDASGEARREALEVRGLAWLDREWGSGALGADQAGWDWFALQLDDGSSLMFYQLRRRDGTIDPASAGTWVSQGGEARPLERDAVSIETLGFWDSPRGGRYPARWRLRVPSLGLDLEVRPLLADQELATTPRYWEGAVSATGTSAGRRTAARGYVELVGYALTTARIRAWTRRQWCASARMPRRRRSLRTRYLR